MTLFVVLAVVLALVAISLVAVPLMLNGGRHAWPAATLSAMVIGVASYFLYHQISDYPWPRAESLAGGAGTTGDLQQRLTTNPADAAAWMALGREHQQQGRYPEARDAFRHAMMLGDASDDELRMAYAETAILADPAALGTDAGQIMEDLLQRHPEDPRALWFGGMVAVSRGEPELARERWSRLLELSPPPEVRTVLEEQIAAIDAAKPESEAHGGMPTISVKVAIAPELSVSMAEVDERAMLFVIVRLQGVSGPPLAVVRRPASSLPTNVIITEKDLITSRKINEPIQTIKLTARISRSGMAEAAAGDWYGEGIWRSDSGAAVTVLIDQVVR